MHILKNIVKVEYIEERLMVNTTIVPGGIFLNYIRNWKELPIIGLAECSVVSSTEDNNKVFTTKLTAYVGEHINLSTKHYCLLITAVDGSHYLIGLNMQPYVVVETEDIMPGKETDKSGCTLTATLKGYFGALRVLDL